MATIASRLVNDGTLLVNGTVDEFTGAPTIDSNVKTWYDAGQTSSYSGTGTTVTDLSSNYNGTLTNGPTFASSVAGGSFYFDGVDDYIATSIPDSFWQGNWSVSFWINFSVINTGSSGTDRPLVQHGSSVLRSGLHLTQRSSVFYFGLYGDDVGSIGALSADTWYNVVFTLNNSTYLKQIYINGVLNRTHTGGGPYIGTGTNTRICGRLLFGSWFNGYLSNCIFYDRVITQDEVIKNYNATAGRVGFTANTSATTITRQTVDTVLAAQFDEVTLNPISAGLARKIYQNGDYHIAGEFDEFTGAPVVDGNVVLWLDAGQTASYSGSGTTWTDLSTTSLNGTLVNTPTFSNSGYITFDRTQSERVDFADSAAVDFTGTSPYTLEAWVYPNSNYPTQTYAGIMNHESNPGTGRDGWNMWLRGNAAANSTMTFATERFALGAQSAPSFDLDSSVVVGNWHHIVATYDGSNIRMYRNGSLAAGPSSSSLSITNTTVTLTMASRGTGSYFDGRISAAKIYNRALTADEVAQNFNALRRRYGI